ncbi:hypothetical protein Nmel_003089 [Mimus melanotis]
MGVTVRSCHCSRFLFVVQRWLPCPWDCTLEVQTSRSVSTTSPPPINTPRFFFFYCRTKQYS